MATEQVTENRLVITAKGKAANWVWLHRGGWKQGLANPSVDRYGGDITPANEMELGHAVIDGMFEYADVTEVRHYF
jgi:hypothetical protein